jgi:hypothetical protein
LFTLSLAFPSSVFLPSFQKGRFDDFSLPVVASGADSEAAIVSGSWEDDFEESVDCGNDPGSRGAIDPRDSVSLGGAENSL